MSFRQVLTIAVFVLIACVIVGQLRQLLADPTIWPPDDFVEYYAAAKLTLEGKNPYDATLLLPIEQAAGRDTDYAVMMWNPPWTLAVVMPLGFLPAREAQLLWFAFNLLVIGFCGDRLWLLFAGSRERRWQGGIIALIALPTAFALQSGQISPLLLLGAVLFLECEKRGWQYCAGAATVLLAIKPHLAYLVWVAILFDAVIRGRWRTVVGGAVAGLICAIVPYLFDPRIFQQYSDAMGNRPPAEWISPTIGTVLRQIFGVEMFRLQFIPMMIGLFWFAWHCRPYRSNSLSESSCWDWNEQLPLLLLVSFVTAPYGAWPFDMVLLLPVAMWLIIRTEQRSHTVVVAGLITVNMCCLILNVLRINSFWFLWVSPAVLVLYLIANKMQSREDYPKSVAVTQSDRALVSV
jgi:hypothetical protein